MKCTSDRRVALSGTYGTMSRLVLLCALVCFAFVLDARADDDAPAVGFDTMPILRLEAGGPTSFISGLAMNKDGSALYAGGWDKVVRSWNWNPASRRFELDPVATYRVPVGPGLDGVINAIAVSPDGLWLAAAGQGVVRGASDLRHTGWRVPTAGVMNPEMRADQGVIHLFNTHTREVRPLRGHTAPVVALAFAPTHPNKPPLLISAGEEWDDQGQRYLGAVRAWDVNQAKYIGGITLPDVGLWRPGLAAWHFGEGAKQVRVAVAWGDDSKLLRLWDMDTTAPRTRPDERYNHTVAWWSEGGALVSGGVGKLRKWSVPADANGTPSVAGELPLSPNDLPRAITLFSSAPGGKVDRAAVAVKAAGADAQLRILVVDLVSFRLLNGSGLSLGNGGGITPALASAPGAARLAIAGNAAHDIFVPATGELTASGKAPSTLAGAGMDLHSASFVEKAGALGILVSSRKKPAQGGQPLAPATGDLVFQPAARKVTNQIGGWQANQPNAGRLRVQPAAAATPQNPQRPAVALLDGDRTVRQITLPDGRRVTECALLPATAPINRPIVAVASRERGGKPILELYDGSTGKLIRDLPGHVEAIESIAFLKDGKLMVTVASDRTVCIWNTGDLDQVIGTRSSLPGVTFRPRDDGTLEVADVQADSPNASQLARGDEIVSWGDQTPCGSLVDFYLRVSHLSPTSTVSLNRRRNGQPAVIELKLDQGTDERKPLLTLFVSPGAPWHWIGWSPLGPYESSGDAVEQLLGWHFNTGLADPPTRFATAGEYQSLRREGLIDYLLKNRELPSDKPAALERPAMSVRLRQPGRDAVLADGTAPLKLGGKDAVLDLEIRGLGPDQVRDVTWQSGEEPPRSLQQESPQVWTASLADLKVGRAAVPVSLAITTNETEPQTFDERVSLVYCPPAPRIEPLAPEAELTVVSDGKYTLKAQVRSQGVDNEPLAAEITHLADGKEVLSKKLTADGLLSIEQPLELQAGDNVIKVVATSANANCGTDSPEQSVLVRRLTFNRQAVAPPRLKLQVISSASARQQDLTSDQAEPLVVDSASMRLVGDVTADKPLSRAAWSLGDKETPFAKFTAGKSNKLEVQQDVTLKPGVQQIRCVAQAEESQPTEVSVAVDYRPRLPDIFISTPKSNQTLVEGRDSRKIKLTGRLQPTKDASPYYTEILINGKASDEPPVIDEKGEAFSAELELEPGENRIEAQLTNEWGAQATSEAIRVRYARPPRVVSLSAPAEVNAPLAEVTFLVDSPAELPITGLQVNGWELPASAAELERTKEGTSRWKVVAREIPLREGVNEVRPFARNADGWSVNPQPTQVKVMLPPPPKPIIEFLSPQIDGVSESPVLDIRYLVRSESRLKRVEVRSGDRRVAEIDASRQIQDRERPAGNKPAWFRLETTTRVTLEPQVNNLRVVAINEGGEAQQELKITYVRKPVEVLIDRLLPQRERQTALVPEREEGGRIAFTSESGEANLWLHGRVRWPDATSQRENPVNVVQVWVNGRLQRPVPLEAQRAGDLQWPWRARIRLNQNKDNLVSIRLPGVHSSADNRLEFKVSCKNPDERQRLHLLVVGVGEEDPQQLEARALEAVNGRRADGEQIEAPAFDKGWIYPLSSGYVNRRRINAQLERIHLRASDAIDAGSDVVVVYYRGEEAVDDKGQFFLLTSQSRWDRDMASSAISGKDLAERFRSFPGAQLFLLDVQRQVRLAGSTGTPVPTPALWPASPQMAALRYVWLEQGSTPPDARLLTALDAAIPKASRLGAIEQEVARHSEAARKRYGVNFRYEQHVPEALRTLLLAKSAMMD